MKGPKPETPETGPANAAAAPAKEDPAGREFEPARPKVPTTISRDKWGDLQGQQGGQGWEKE